MGVSISGQPLASDIKIARAIRELGGAFSFDPDPNDGKPLGIGAYTALVDWYSVTPLSWSLIPI